MALHLLHLKTQQIFLFQLSLLGKYISLSKLSELFSLLHTIHHMPLIVDNIAKSRISVVQQLKRSETTYDMIREISGKGCDKEKAT